VTVAGLIVKDMGIGEREADKVNKEVASGSMETRTVLFFARSVLQRNGRAEREVCLTGRINVVLICQSRSIWRKLQTSGNSDVSTTCCSVRVGSLVCVAEPADPFRHRGSTDSHAW
jgi:hypothetical protein